LQEEAVTAVMSACDCLLVLPTGGGKSLCYQTPAACGRGLVLVVSPLISLMDDQVAAARQAGLRAAALHSQVEESERRSIRRQASAGELQVLYVSPERLMIGDLAAGLRSELALFAIDEAHCVSHWGHDFRPEYRQLRSVLDQAPEVPRMALTATATPQVQEDICAQLGLRGPRRLIGHVDRPNLTYRALPRHDMLAQVLQVIRRHAGEGGIVYGQTRRDVEQLAEGAARHGVSCAAYHAGLPGAKRRAVQSDFVAERLEVVVATIAFGMGSDRSDVRYLVHASSPKSIENYQQEAGRARRDGLPAECVLLFSGADLVKHRFLATADGPLQPERQRALERQLREIGQFAVAPVCRHRILAERFGQRYPALPGEQASESCGACDVCLGETQQLESQEALVTAQKIISAVWRTGGRFGPAHVAQVLLGRASEMIQRHRHDELSVFGLLAHDGEVAVRSWIDQLVVQGYLELVERDQFTFLTMTEAGRALCRERVNPPDGARLGRYTRPRARRGGQRSGAEAAVRGGELFERLRSLRRLLADRQGVPPYVVFTDLTLSELAARRPSSLIDMRAVRGIGDAKLERYGQAFLAVLGGASSEDAAGMWAG